jgi:hypothetical protein
VLSRDDSTRIHKIHMPIRCRQCASDLEDGEDVCAHCSSEADRSQPVQPEQLLARPVSLDSTSIKPMESAGLVAADPFYGTLFDSDQHLEGLTGWLALVGMGLVVSPFRIVFSALKANIALLTNVQFRPFLETHPTLEGLIIFEIATNVILVAILIALNFLFFTKKRAFPTYMILYFILQLVLISIDMAATHIVLPSTQLRSSYAAVETSLIGALVWIPYFIVSRRVKVTFVR